MGFLEDLLTNTFDPKYGFLGRPMSGALRSGIDLTRALPRQLAPVLTPWLKQENFQEDPNTTRLLDEILGGGLKEKLVDEPVSQNAGLKEPVPAEVLLRQALLPDLTTADINPISKPSMDFPTGLPRTSEDVNDVVSTRHQIGGALESAAGLALDPSVLAIPSVPGMGGLFLPGIAENLGTNIGQEEYGKAAIDALFGGLISKHLAKGAAEPVIERGTNIQVPKGGYKVEPEAVRDYNREELDRPEFKNFSQEARDLESAPTKIGGSEEFNKLVEEQTGNASDIYDTRLVNMIDAYLKRIEPEAGRTLADVVPKDIFIEVNRDPKVVPQGAAFSKELNTLYINPDVFADKLPGEITSTILHELAHTREGHSERTKAKTETGEEVTEIPISEDVTAQLPPEVQEHNWKNLPEAAKVSPKESKFLTGQEALINNPNIRAISEKFEKNLGALNAPEFRRRRGLPTFEEEGEALPEVEAAPKEKTELVKGLESTEKQTEDFNTNEARQARRIAQEAENLRNFKAGTHDKYGNRLRESAPSSKKSELEPTEETISTEKVVSEPANILRKLLTETKLTKFNKSNLVAELEAKVGSSLPDEVKSNIPELLSELKERGWINEKVGGTYTLLIEPPKRITEINKGKESPKPTSDLEATLRASLEHPPEKPTPKTKQSLDDIVTELTDKAKKEKEVPEEVLLARKAAENAGKKKPPKEPSEEVTEEGEGKKKAFDVTLSDGSTHTVRAESSEAAQAKAEELLSQYNSTKTVDKVEEHLGSLERAAKYEIEPVKEGLEEVKDVETELRGAKKEEVKTFTEEEKLRKAQTKEKFQKKTFTVVLSNGEKVNVKARNEQAAKEYIENKIRTTKSKAKVYSISPKKTPLEKALEGTPSDVKQMEKGIVDDITDIPKTLKSAFDISWPGRQGLFLLNRKIARKGIIEGTKSGIPVWGKEHHEKIMTELDNRPNAALYRQAGLNQVRWDPKEDISARSEQFASERASSLPGLRHSERAFNDAGNLARANMFDEFTEKWTKEGKTFKTHPDLYKGLADYLNVLTMRKPLPEKIRQAGWILNKTFFSPMAVYSRLEMANPLWYTKLPKELRGAALRDIGGTLGTIVGLLGATKIAATQAGIDPDDLDVSFDPAHTHFMRLKIKETYYDLPGITPMVRTFYRIISGRKATPKGNYKLPGGILSKFQKDLEEAPFGSSAFNELGGFFENKTSPPYHAIKGALSGKGWYGKEYGFADVLSDLFMPMSPEQTIEAGTQYGPEAVVRQLPNFFGIGTQITPKNEDEEDLESMSLDNPLGR